MRTFVDAMKSAGRAYGRLPLLAKVPVGLVVIAVVGYIAVVLIHHIFAINTCPWYPPDCPKNS